MRETWVWSLGREDTLEKGMATHSSILAWTVFQGQRSLKGYSPWGHIESDPTDFHTHTHNFTKSSNSKRQQGLSTTAVCLKQPHSFFFGAGRGGGAGCGLCWVFLAAHKFSLVVASGGSSLLQFAGFSSRWLLLLQNIGSRAQAQ